MSDLRDPDDAWTRLQSALRKRQTELTDGVVTGELTPKQYDAECGKIAMAVEVLGLIRTIRRGEDINPPQEVRSAPVSVDDR